MSHRYHPDTSDEYGDPKDAILFGECEDCARHATALGLSLDVKNWWAMWDRMLAVEIEGTEAYLTSSEANLGRQMYYVYVALERYTTVDPTLRGFLLRREYA